MIFNTGFELFAEADFFTDGGPVFLSVATHFTKAGFAGGFEKVIPDGGNCEIVIIPEFTFVLGAVGGNCGVPRMIGVGLAVFVEEIGEPDFDKDVVTLNVFLELFLVFNNGILESDTVWTD